MKRVYTGARLAALKRSVLSQHNAIVCKTRELESASGRLQERYLTHACPLVKDDLVKWRGDDGRIRYGRVNVVHANIRSYVLEARLPEWIAGMRETLRTGALPTRRGTFNLRLREGMQFEVLRHAGDKS